MASEGPQRITGKYYGVYLPSYTIYTFAINLSICHIICNLSTVLYSSLMILLIKYSKINFLVTGAEPFRGDIISTTQYGLDVTFHQDSVTIMNYQCLLFSPPFEGGLRGVGPFATWPLLLPPRGAAASHPYLRPGTRIFKYMIVREAKRVGLRCCCCVSQPRRPGRRRSARNRSAKRMLFCYRFLNNVGLLRLQWCNGSIIFSRFAMY